MKCAQWSNKQFWKISQMLLNGSAHLISTSSARKQSSFLSSSESQTIQSPDTRKVAPESLNVKFTLCPFIRKFHVWDNANRPWKRLHTLTLFKILMRLGKWIVLKSCKSNMRRNLTDCLAPCSQSALLLIQIETSSHSAPPGLIPTFNSEKVTSAGVVPSSINMHF